MPPDWEGRNRTLNHLIQSQVALPVCVLPNRLVGRSLAIAIGCRSWGRTSISVIQSHSDFPGRPLGNEWLPQ